jgi:hypothetical protein
MATSTMRLSSTAIVNDALGDVVASSHDAVITQAANKYQLLFKAELNANPTKVNDYKASGKYKQGGVITNLGGCGQLSRNTNDDSAFMNITLRPKIKDAELGFIVNPDFILPLFHVTLEQDAQILAMNEYLKTVGQPTLAASGKLVEKFVSSNKLSHVLNEYFATPEIKMYFNSLQNFLSEETLNLMEVEKGLLTVYFAMDLSRFRNPKPKKNAEVINQLIVADKDKPKEVESYAIAAFFEADKTASNVRPRNVVPAARRAAALQVLLSDDFTESLDVNGNIELSESIFTKIENDRNDFLDSIGTGKKAHKSLKEALEASVAKGEWDKDTEYKLYAIARRGLNIHYTMKNHDTFVAKLRAEAGDDVVIVSAPIVIEEKVAAPNVASNPAATVDEDDDEDFGFVPNIPILPSEKTEDDDVNIVI